MLLFYSPSFFFWSFHLPSCIHSIYEVQRKQKNKPDSSFPEAHNSKWSRSQCALWKLTRSQLCTCKGGFTQVNHSCMHQKESSTGMCRREKGWPQARILNTESVGDYLENFLVKMIPYEWLYIHVQHDSVNAFCCCGPKVHTLDWNWNASNAPCVLPQTPSVVTVLLHRNGLQSFQRVWKQIFMGYVCNGESGGYHQPGQAAQAVTWGMPCRS